jgi:hypothetical protein
MAVPISNVVAGRWIVTLRHYSTPKMMATHRTLISTKTADPTPFECEIHDEFDFPELRGYSASFDEATKVEIEEMHEVLKHRFFQSSFPLSDIAPIRLPPLSPSSSTVTVRSNQTRRGDSLVSLDAPSLPPMDLTLIPTPMRQPGRELWHTS